MFTTQILQQRLENSRPGSITVSQSEGGELLKQFGLLGEHPAVAELNAVNLTCDLKVAEMHEHQESLVVTIKNLREDREQLSLQVEAQATMIHTLSAELSALKALRS